MVLGCLAGAVFIRIVIRDRIFLGKHTFDQVFLGLQLGVWTALYMHFGWRDQIHHHVTVICQIPWMTRLRAYRYIGIASIAYSIVFLLMAFYVMLVQATTVVDQSWLANLKACGFDFDQINNQLRPKTPLFALPELKTVAHLSVLYASYSGLVLYRL